MNILEAYRQYSIMPQLAEHQLRVGAVADFLCERLPGKLDREAVVTACLLHDMGNILKVDLDNPLFPEALAFKGSNYWKAVQADFRRRYGSDEHAACMAIAKELGVSQRVAELIDCIGFTTAAANADSDDYDRKVCAYSDMRVDPNGVVSLEDRFADLRARYEAKRMQIGTSEAAREAFEDALRKIERQLFSGIGGAPADITDASIRQGYAALQKWKVG